jgi:predicted nucleic acid-binding protein
VILVDTSVWIRFLANREPYASRMAKLLQMDVVAAHELVHGELLIGDSSGRLKFLSESYEQLSPAETVSHAEVFHFVRHHRLHGSGLGWIDAHLLASAKAGGMLLWTADNALALAAQQMHVQYSPAR